MSVVCFYCFFVNWFSDANLSFLWGSGYLYGTSQCIWDPLEIRSGATGSGEVVNWERIFLFTLKLDLSTISILLFLILGIDYIYLGRQRCDSGRIDCQNWGRMITCVYIIPTSPPSLKPLGCHIDSPTGLEPLLINAILMNWATSLWCVSLLIFLNLLVVFNTIDQVSFRSTHPPEVKEPCCMDLAHSFRTGPSGWCWELALFYRDHVPMVYQMLVVIFHAI